MTLEPVNGKRSPSLKVVNRKPPSLSPHIKKPHESNRALTFLQSARERNIPVRSGKWNSVEEHYLRKLVELFCMGLLDDIEPKTSMRSWLSKMLNCCPMRISKKQMHGEKFTGKAKFKRNEVVIHAMTQEQYDVACHQLIKSRCDFLIQWIRDEYRKRGAKESFKSFRNWYIRAIDALPKPCIAKKTSLMPIHSSVEQNLMTAFLQTFESSLSMKESNIRPHERNVRSCKRARSIKWDEDSYAAERAKHTKIKDRKLYDSQVYSLLQSSSNWTSEHSDAPSQEDKHSELTDKCMENTMESDTKSSETIRHFLDTMNRSNTKNPSPCCIDFGLPSAWDFNTCSQVSTNTFMEWNDLDLMDDSASASSGRYSNSYDSSSDLWNKALLV